MFFPEGVKALIDEDNMHLYVPKRKTATEKGQKISEWTVEKEEIMKFLSSSRLGF
jgi:hypothetical protein